MPESTILGFTTSDTHLCKSTNYEWRNLEGGSGDPGSQVHGHDHEVCPPEPGEEERSGQFAERVDWKWVSQNVTKYNFVGTLNGYLIENRRERDLTAS